MALESSIKDHFCSSSDDFSPSSDGSAGKMAIGFLKRGYDNGQSISIPSLNIKINRNDGLTKIDNTKD